KHFKPITKKDLKWFSITMLCTLFTQAPLYFAYNRLDLGTATLICYAFFLITSYFVGWLFLKEKMTTIKILSCVLAFIGLLITFGLSFSAFSIPAMLLSALNGIAGGGEIATSKKSTHRYSSLQIIAYSWIFILATHYPLSIIIGEQQITPAFNIEWLAMLGYALSGLLGFWLIVEGFKHIDASIGSLIGLLEIPLSIIFGFILFNDPLTLSIFAGGSLIILSVILPDLYALKNRKNEPTPTPLPH
ncbi:MAG TPA: DMT family transporter, partial [Gammaproteobacteria bacterium]|nr:DMT family transporter [Gammaproteobacteria bacterium]